MVEVTIIIPTFFAGDMLYNCLGSIHKAVPNARTLVYQNDVGWLKACNDIMKTLKTDVILLNDDTIVLTDIVTEMQKLAYSDDRIGIVGGKALAANNPDMIINYGIYVGPDGNTAHKHFGQPRDSVDVETQRAVEGSCIYIKNELLYRVGYFDEDFGMGYRAEVDFCFRAREEGWKTVSCPTAEYIHFEHQTAGPLKISNDTHELFMRKWGTRLKMGKV